MVFFHLLLEIFCCLSLRRLAAAAAAADVNAMKPECPTRCGDVSIPYPFGMGDSPSCYRNIFFKISCNESFTPAKPFFGIAEVVKISLQGQMTINTSIGWDCYNKKGRTSNVGRTLIINEDFPFTFSHTRNLFTAIGCDTIAYFRSSWGYSGCMSYCKNQTGMMYSCTGIGCCQSSIPAGVKNYSIHVESFSNHTHVLDLNRCSFIFLVDQDQFKFFLSDLKDINFWDRSSNVPVVLDWVVASKACREAQANKTGYACVSENSTCVDSSDGGGGYRCNCSAGFDGNPYVHGGCRDIDECQDTSNNPCKGICLNRIGGYNCTCPEGYHGDGTKEGSGCIENSKQFPVPSKEKQFPVMKFILGTGTSLLFLLICSTWTYWVWRERKMIKRREKFFEQNGGLLLQQKISSRRGESLKIFTAKELERATENFSDNMIVGQGGYGIVYKEILPGNIIVAIKKSKTLDTSQIVQFINEVDILSQINHRNVVKLLGCCLEDQVPLLVYEFVSNGTLYSHIHECGHTRSMSLKNRLRIATETAEALAYLHSATSIPIFHRDIKSNNILLDNNLTAKVSDFGASRLVPIDQTQITTMVQGTFGYLDPEYFQTSQLTAKSDVYSFGVVLMELLTAEKPVCFSRPQEERNLAMHFILAMKENRLFQILEDRVKDEGPEEQLIAIAQLARRCLRVKGEKRPTMKEVAVELLGLSGFQDHPWVKNNTEETESLLGGALQGCTGEASGQYGLETRFISSLEIGR